MKRISEILKDLEEGKISSNNAENKILMIINGNVNHQLSIAQKLLASIISADPNLIKEPKSSDIIIRSLYRQCKKLIANLITPPNRG